jgi:hypothetical protein
MRSTFQNAGMSLSIGIFFSLLIAGLAARMPPALTAGLRAKGVPAGVAAHIAHLPPVSTLFASFLGRNPVASLLKPSGVLGRLPASSVSSLTSKEYFPRRLLKPSGVLGRLPASSVSSLTSKEYFPRLVAGPFHHGLVIVFSAAIAMSLTGALVSLLRGRQFIYEDGPVVASPVAASPVVASTAAAESGLPASALAGDGPADPVIRAAGKAGAGPAAGAATAGRVPG